MGLLRGSVAFWEGVGSSSYCRDAVYAFRDKMHLHFFAVVAVAAVAAVDTGVGVEKLVGVALNVAIAIGKE